MVVYTVYECFAFFVIYAKIKFTNCEFNILDKCTTSAVTSIPELYAFIIVFIQFIIRILRQCLEDIYQNRAW